MTLTAKSRAGGPATVGGGEGGTEASGEGGLCTTGDGGRAGESGAGDWGSGASAGLGGASKPPGWMSTRKLVPLIQAALSGRGAADWPR